MAYLEVTVQQAPGGTTAIAANGFSLARSNGCLAFFIGSMYPSAIDYFDALEREGWVLVSTSSSSTMGMIEGLPFIISGGTYTFRGNGRYQIEWVNDDWRFLDNSPKNYNPYANGYEVDNAVQNNNGRSYYLLGEKFYRGENCEKDYQKAISYYKEAAKHGCAVAYIMIAYIYKGGFGVEKDLIAAINNLLQGIDTEVRCLGELAVFFRIYGDDKRSEFYWDEYFRRSQLREHDYELLYKPRCAYYYQYLNSRFMDNLPINYLNQMKQIREEIFKHSELVIETGKRRKSETLTTTIEFHEWMAKVLS